MCIHNFLIWVLLKKWIKQILDCFPDDLIQCDTFFSKTNNILYFQNTVSFSVTNRLSPHAYERDRAYIVFFTEQKLKY